jgi:methionyl-tRNA synthetase
VTRTTFYVTTPIYYVNAAPHLGTAYTTIAADVIARYKRLCGFDVHFLTGTDEHGQKVAKSAEESGLDPKSWADTVVPQFHEAWKLLEISNDDFIRTTEARHERGAAAFMQRVYDSGHIRKDHYEGWYCIHDETFFTEEQVGPDRVCPDCSRPVQLLKEENYFFKLSAFAEPLLDHIRTHPDFVQPEIRKNEVVSFIEMGLKDLSISRPMTSLTWGIPLPFDPEHVMYVWFDALLNYITAIGYGEDERRFDRYWPVDWHLVGKDIIRFHCVIWPAMLMAAGVALPQHVFAHGFLLAKGEKMSKSKGNVLAPADLVARFGADAYRYYFMREVPFGGDGSISIETMILRYNADLANDYGNLVSRLTNMFEKYLGGVVPANPGMPRDWNTLDGELIRSSESLYADVDTALETLQFSDALKEIWERVRLTNRYVEESAPWNLAKDHATHGRLKEVLWRAAEAVRILTLFVWPVMPAAAEKAWDQLGITKSLGTIPQAAGACMDVEEVPDGLRGCALWGKLPEGANVHKGESLFPRIYEEEPSTS